MNRTVKLGVALAAALVTFAGAAQAFTPAFEQTFDLKGGGQVKVKPTKAQLGIVSPADGVCPGNAKVSAWVFTNKPGTVQVTLVNEQGGAFGPYPVKTSKGSGGVVMGSLNTGFAIDAPTDTRYRVVVAGTPVVSNWVPLTACL
ncbi:MAG TPA: hypothetical protein PK286_01960 [Devosia sp.]|nr:hypothetical protein [Devosia sp.]